jgi:hypothetical protein
VIKIADWIIDLGPEARPGLDPGMALAAKKPVLGLDTRIAAGAPEDVVREKRSYTGAFLKPILNRQEKPKKRIKQRNRIGALSAVARRAKRRRRMARVGEAEELACTRFG